MSNWDWERIGLMLLFISFSIYGWIEINREAARKPRPTHRYNRQTGKVEKIEDE